MARTKQKTGTIYRLKIKLDGIKPAIWREIETEDCTLSRLHDLIQDAMGWEGYHLWSFEVGGIEYALEPEMDWGLEMDAEDPDDLTLEQIVASGEKQFHYEYDFGDSWGHTIKITRVLDRKPDVEYPRCIGGSRACPPEDCGGVWGYENFLAAIRDPKHPEHKDMMEWFGGKFDPEEFDLQAVDRELRGSTRAT